MIIMTCSNPSWAGMVTGEEKVYLLSESLTVHNRTSTSQSRGVLTMTIPCSEPPWQQVRIISVTPSGYRTTMDRDGNILLEMPLPSLAKGGKFTATVKTEVRSQRVLFDIDAAALPPFPEALSPYWQATPEFPSKDALFEKTAAELAGNEQNPYYRAVLIYDFVRGFTYRLSDAPKPALSALTTRKVQCSDAVAVLITLLRTLRIPARYVAGISLVEGRSSITHTHAWAEIFFPGEGWVPLDPTLSRFNDGARLTRFAEHEPGQILFSLNRMSPYQISLEKGEPPKRSSIDLSFSYREKEEKGSSDISDYYYRKMRLPEGGTHTEEDLFTRISPAAKKQYDSAVGLMEQGRLKEAEKSLEKLVSKDGRYVPAWKKLIEISRMQGREELESRRKELEAWHQRDGNDALPCLLLGMAAMESSRYSSAYQHFRDAEKRSMSSPQLFDSLGYLAITTKQYSLTVDSYSRALQHDSTDLVALGNMLNFFSLYRGWGSMASLAGYAMKQHRNGPLEQYFAASYALALLEKKDTDGALGFLTPALRKWPGDGWLTCLAGLAYHRKGDDRQARRLLVQGLKMNPPDRAYFEKTLQEIQRKEGAPHRKNQQGEHGNGKSRQG